MRKIRIVSDSSSDITSLEQVDFAYSPMKITTADREFVDDSSLRVEEMVQFLDKYKGRSKTSCPNVTDWLNAFGDADDIFCVTITSALSGSYNSAVAAKRVYEAEHEGSRVFVLDTLSAGPEITMVIERLSECVQGGMSYEEICCGITEYLENTGLVFMLKSLRNFANNGRVSPIIAKLVGFAGICIVGKASDEGTLEQSHKCRGELRSLDALLADMNKLGYRGGRVSIGHCENESAARRLEKMLTTKYKDARIDIHSLRGLCSFYAERGGLLVGFEKGGRTEEKQK
ncbi:MAG: DegV family protein [Clostridia bacterium]|nr:DegV family protein [Clostridia bacterium]